MVEAQFDSRDIDYMVQNLSLDQLKREVHNADIQRGVAKCFGEDDEFYWEEFGKACELALIIQRANQPKPKPIVGQVDIQAIKASTDIVANIGKYTKLRKAGKRYQGLCPLHADKKTPSLVVYPDSQSWHCFGCNRGGDVLDFVMMLENCDFRQAVARLGVA